MIIELVNEFSVSHYRGLFATLSIRSTYTLLMNLKVGSEGDSETRSPAVKVLLW